MIRHDLQSATNICRNKKGKKSQNVVFLSTTILWGLGRIVLIISGHIVKNTNKFGQKKKELLEGRTILIPQKFEETSANRYGKAWEKIKLIELEIWKSKVELKKLLRNKKGMWTLDWKATHPIEWQKAQTFRD